MTLKEVAQLAGVSPSAVSRYLNGGPLSAPKSAVIRAVIQRTGYIPNQAAHTLRTGRVRQVGVLVPRIHSEAVSKVTAGIAETLEQRRYLPVLGSTGRDPVREERYLEMMRSYHVAGIIAMATTDAMADAYRRFSLPIVVTGQRLDGLNCVFHDDFGAMRELAERMMERGRRRIVYISVDPRDAAVARERLRGARDALRAAGLARDALHAAESARDELSDNGGFPSDIGSPVNSGGVSDDLLALYREDLSGRDGLPVAVADFSWQSGYHAMGRLLGACPDADGVLCATDTIAQGAMLYLREAGRRIPEDISVAGVGDDWADLVSHPPLTAAQMDQARCGREAASILLSLLENPAASRREICLGYAVVDRGSI